MDSMNDHIQRIIFLNFFVFFMSPIKAVFSKFRKKIENNITEPSKEFVFFSIPLLSKMSTLNWSDQFPGFIFPSDTTLLVVKEEYAGHSVLDDYWPWQPDLVLGILKGEKLSFRGPSNTANPDGDTQMCWYSPPVVVSDPTQCATVQTFLNAAPAAQQFRVFIQAIAGGMGKEDFLLTLRTPSNQPLGQLIFQLHQIPDPRDQVLTRGSDNLRCGSFSFVPLACAHVMDRMEGVRFVNFEKDPLGCPLAVWKNTLSLLNPAVIFDKIQREHQLRAKDVPVFSTPLERELKSRFRFIQTSQVTLPLCFSSPNVSWKNAHIRELFLEGHFVLDTVSMEVPSIKDNQNLGFWKQLRWTVICTFVTRPSTGGGSISGISNQFKLDLCFLCQDLLTLYREELRACPDPCSQEFLAYDLLDLQIVLDKNWPRFRFVDLSGQDRAEDSTEALKKRVSPFAHSEWKSLHARIRERWNPSPQDPSLFVLCDS